MDLLTWLIVGLVAGVLASFVMGGTGLGLIGDIIIGICGAFVGGWILRALHVNVPLGGVPGTILVAFIGAVLLLFIIRVLRRPGRL
jgi:uncharacterized membrane protein YeaQ/YmgE (transglycosylase-associated protein family)